MRDLKKLVRPNVLRMKPYSSARDEYKGKVASVFLDANENPYNLPYNRYPDPLQGEVKVALSCMKGILPGQIFLGNGSDEAIDLLVRAFCVPGVDNVVSIDPTYGMYEVCAVLNDVKYRKVSLNADYGLCADKLLQSVDKYTKMIFLCSPNNPTGNSLCRNEVKRVLECFDGIVVIDEAYIDFSSEPSWIESLYKYPNLVVLQTFSKAWGCASIRLGMAFASVEIIAILNKIKYPYNVNLFTQREALNILTKAKQVGQWVEKILQERARLMTAFRALSCCVTVYPSDANFFLAKMTDATAIYNFLVSKGIIVRNRSNIALCNNCLRITVGTKAENDYLLDVLANIKN